MENFEATCNLVKEQIGHDVEISLATCVDNQVGVRIVDGYYKDGCVYVMTRTSTNKIKDILINPNVSFCYKLFQGFGIGENLGNPKEEQNRELAKELREAFIRFYDKNIDENNPKTCILKIKMTRAVAFGSDAKYIIDYINETAEKLPYKKYVG